MDNYKSSLYDVQFLNEISNISVIIHLLITISSFILSKIDILDTILIISKWIEVIKMIQHKITTSISVSNEIISNHWFPGRNSIHATVWFTIRKHIKYKLHCRLKWRKAFNQNKCAFQSRITCHALGMSASIQVNITMQF